MSGAVPHTAFPTLPSLSGELHGRGWVVKTTVWAITAVITAFLVTLQANAMWKRLIHGSQVLNTTTPLAVAVIPPVVCDPQQLPSPFPPQAPLSGGRGRRHRRKGGGELWLPGGQRQDVGNKERVLQTHFIPIHNLCLNSHGIQTAAPNKAQVWRGPCWFYKIFTWSGDEIPREDRYAKKQHEFNKVAYKALLCCTSWKRQKHPTGAQGKSINPLCDVWWMSCLSLTPIFGVASPNHTSQRAKLNIISNLCPFSVFSLQQSHP